MSGAIAGSRTPGPQVERHDQLVQVTGSSLSLMHPGTPSTGRNQILRAEVRDDAGIVIHEREVPLPADGSLLVFEHDGDFMVLDELDARGLTAFDAETHDDPLITPSDDWPDEPVDLDQVREWLTVSPGDGPSLVELSFREDAWKATVEVTTRDSLMWSGDFTEAELDANREIVEEVYQEWFNAEIEVPDSWDEMTVRIDTTIDCGRATKLLALDAVSGPYAKFRNETDPGTFGSPYVGAEIRRRIDEAAER